MKCDQLNFYCDGTLPMCEGVHLVVIQKAISEKATLLNALAVALRFPEYFGHNWDALDECLADLSWITSEQVVLWHEDIPLIADPSQAGCYLRILTGVSSEQGDHRLIIWFPEGKRDEVEALI